MDEALRADRFYYNTLWSGCMEVSFTHMNPGAGHESTLLSVRPETAESKHYLVDAGRSVSPQAFLSGEETIDGIFLTHAHSDHYESLGDVLAQSDESVPVYASPQTSAIFAQVFSEANTNRDIGTTDTATETVVDAFQPINEWTDLAPDVDVLPLPAGHTPDAAAFLFRVDDIETHGESVTILVTGDFTQRSDAGHPGLSIPDRLDIDVMVANATTNDTFETDLNDVVSTVLERALGGATVVVGAGALTGVHVAFLFGHLSARLGRALPVCVAGQAAKLYETLEYDVPSVTATPTFDEPGEILGPGHVTIAGPAVPRRGSTERLFGAIADDPGALYVQLASSADGETDGAVCAVQAYELGNHPSSSGFQTFVEENLPRHLLPKHVDEGAAREIGREFDSVFHWANDDLDEHTLYADGSFVAPHWVTDSRANLIRKRNYRESEMRIPVEDPAEEVAAPDWTEAVSNPSAEGVDEAALVDAFGQETDQDGPEHGDTSEATDGDIEQPAAPRPTTIDDQEEFAAAVASQIEDRLPEPEDGELAALREQVAAIETALEDRVDTIDASVESGFDELGDTVTDLETEVQSLATQVAELERPSTPATVVRQGDLLLFRVDPANTDALPDDLEHGQAVQVVVDSSGQGSD